MKKLNAKPYTLKDQSGQSILEVIVAMAIFSLISAAMISMVTGSFVGLTQGGEQTQAEALAQEGVEAVKAIYGEAWNQLTYSTSSVAISGDKWVFNGEGTTETIGQFTRTISFANVCRDGSDNITTCSGSYTDVQSKKVTATVTWDTRDSVSNTVQRIGYITNWDSREWTQTDWSGGTGQSIWSNATKYNSGTNVDHTTTAGQISLISGDTKDDGFNFATNANHDWPFTTGANYTYDSAKIQVTGGVAELKQQGGSTASGDTTNPTFDTDTNGWTYFDWEQGGGADVTGARVATGGNPNGYINVSIPGKKNQNLSGYWEQSFTTTVSNPSIATTTLDWIITAFANSNLTSYNLYVFVDSASGAPVVGQQVWSSGNITNTTSWASVPAIDVSSKLGAAGTYYLKVAARVVFAGGGGNPGTLTAGFDNVRLHWEKTSGGSYPTDKPSIYPNSSFSAPGLTSWASFTETATKNGGQIYYQLSNDDGSTWQYWNGASWAAAGASNYNAASVVNTNIGSFPITNEKIRFKAFLESDGSQLVQLDNINIAANIPATPVWNFATWGVSGQEVAPTGAQQTSGGNPGNYVDVTIAQHNNDTVGGYWEQPFTTYRDNPTGTALNFDYKVIDYNSTPNTLHIRAYIDTTSGAPTTQVGSSISVTGIGNWTSAVQIDPSAAITTAGTYYLKIAVWADLPGGNPGPYTIGFDNVNINLGNGEYPTSGTLTSSAFNMSDASPVQTIEWDETIPSCSPVCTNTIDVSTAPNSGGSPGTWTSWQSAATSRGTLLPTSLNGNQWVRYRANLTGDGGHTPTLQEVRINYK